MLKHRLKPPNKGLFLSWLCLLVGMVLFVVVNKQTSYAANPTTINFQGKVVNSNGTNEASGSVSRAFIFRLYQNVNISTYNPNTLSCASDSNCVWEESDTLTVKDGVFQVELGAVCPLFTSNSCNKSTPLDFNTLNALSLTMQFNSDAAGFMTPLMHLQSVPYAFNSDKLGGLTSSGFIQNTSSLQSSSNFNISGTGVAGTALQAPIIQTAAATDLALQPATGIVSLNKASVNNELRVYENAASPSNYASITATSADATFKSNSGTTKIGSTASAALVSILGGTTANTAISLSTSGAGGITIDTGTTGNINIGTGANGKAVAIGNTQSATTATLTSGAVTETLSNTGVAIQTNTNSATGFQVLNAAGLSGITVDTTGGNSNNIVSNPSYETASTTWATTGTATAARTSSQFFNGANALDLSIANSTDEVRLNTFTGSGYQINTTYNLSLYIKASIPMNATLQIGRADVSGTDITCASNQTNYSTGWFRYLCSFKTGGTATNPYIFVKQSDSITRHIYIDAVLMQTEANADANYRDAKITFGGTITSPLILQPGADSNTSLMVQDANGAAVLTVDTTDNNNIVLNPSFEVNTTNWAAKGGDTIARDTTQQKHGLASLKLTHQTTPAANDGAQYTLPASLPATTYAISFDVRLSSGAFGSGTLIAGLVESGSDQNCTALVPAVTASIPLTTGWTRFSCTRVAAAAPTALYIKQTDAASHDYYIDSAQMEFGSTVTPYGLGRISFSGEIITPTTFRNQSDSTLALQVQNAAATNLFTIDTLNSNVQIGSNTTDTTQILLSLDSFSTLADTASCTTSANQGALYYNTNSNEIRACINGAWQDLASTEDLALQLFGVVPNSGPTPGDLVGVNGNANSPCKVYFASTTTYSVAPCNAYSGGRKVAVAQVTGAALGTLANNSFENLCLNSSGVPTLSGGASATDGLQTGANLTSTNATTLGQPLLCLATFKGGASNVIAAIYDIRTFTTTTKTYAVLNSTTQILGGLYHPSTTFGLITADAALTDTNLMGVLVAGTGAASTTTSNVILAIAGAQWVKATGTAAFPAAANTNTGLMPTATAGYVSTATPSTTVSNGTVLGTALAPAIATSCSTNTTAALTNCQDSQFTNITIH